MDAHTNDSNGYEWLIIDNDNHFWWLFIVNTDKHAEKLYGWLIVIHNGQW